MKIQTYKNFKFLLIAFALFFIILFSTKNCFAFTIEQTNHASIKEIADYNYPYYQLLGTGIEGKLNEIKLWGSGNGNKVMKVAIVESSVEITGDNQAGTWIFQKDVDVSETNEEIVIDVSNNNINFDETKYYALRFYWRYYGDKVYFGYTTNDESYQNGNLFYSLPANTWTDENADAYFVLTFDDPEGVFIEDIGGQTFQTNEANFDITWNLGNQAICQDYGTYMEAWSFNLENCSDINSTSSCKFFKKIYQGLPDNKFIGAYYTGETNGTKNQTISDLGNGYYRINKFTFFYNETTSCLWDSEEIIEPATGIFEINDPENPLPDMAGWEQATSTISDTEIGGGFFAPLLNILKFLFIPSSQSLNNQLSGFQENMKTKFPFSYFTEIKSDIDNEITDPETKNLTLKLNLGQLGNNITILSQNNVKNLTGQETWNNIQNLLKWLMWGGFMIYCIGLWRRILSVNKE